MYMEEEGEEEVEAEEVWEVYDMHHHNKQRFSGAIAVPATH